MALSHFLQHSQRQHVEKAILTRLLAEATAREAHKDRLLNESRLREAELQRQVDGLKADMHEIVVLHYEQERDAVEVENAAEAAIVRRRGPLGLIIGGRAA